MKVRQATPEDAEPIAAVHVASWRAAYRGLVPDDLLDSLDVAERSRTWSSILATEEWPCYVAIVESAVIGFIHVCPCRDSDKDPSCTGEISAIYCAPNHWRQGHGSVLLRQGMDALAGRGVSEVTLWVLERNVAARRFYEVHGFCADEPRKIHAKSGLVEIRYAKHCGTGSHV